uniref:DC-STAMP domain-containing protein 2 n=1 Tax=Ascaris suum TaxID=6253 RepID=F1KW81_ASCSU
MSFLLLYRQRNNASAKLQKFLLIAENCRRSVAGEPLLIDKWVVFRRKVGKIFPPLRPHPRSQSSNVYERMFDHGTRENDLMRIVLTVIVCESVGLFFFITLAIKYATFPSRLGVYVSICVQAIMGLMIAFPSIRAIVLIAVPSLVTSKLRSILLLFILSWSFQIPAMNTTKNLESLAESVGCVRDSVVTVGNQVIEETNQQSNKFSLEAYKAHVRYFAKHLFTFLQTLRKLQAMVAGFGRQAKDYLKHVLLIKQRCERFFIGPYYFCINIFEDAATTCDRLVIFRNDYRCQFIKELKHICEVARFTEQVCVLPERVKESLRHGFLSFVSDQVKIHIATVLNALNFKFYLQEAKNLKRTWQEELGFSLNMSEDFDSTHSIDFKKMKMSLREQVERYGMFAQYLSSVITCIIAPLILLPFIVATIYAIRYNSNEKIDNCYITGDLRNLDLLREARGQPTILPLLPREKQNYIEGFTLHMVAAEKTKMIIAFASTIIGGFLPLILILLDIFTYHIIYYSYEFFQSNLTRTDRLDHYVMQVSGEGFAANLLKRILKIFNPITGGMADDDDWRNCFGEPTPPDYSLFQLIFLIYVISLVLCILQVYANRLRRLVASHYWPHRSKPRALYLFNEILEGRKNILSQTVKAAKKRELEEQLAHDELAGRAHIINRGLPILGADQYQCVRCGRPDLSITDASNSRICPNCNSLYCTDCYAVRKKCLDCQASLQVS